ncbi:hypothetical protein H2248_011636 [Termitomyces sp. 'cryptogamus']|nr:hypothetical protein H2248_011636 [Termitomyces sp. 'cryptogamus']
MPTMPVLPVLNDDFFVFDAIEFNMEHNATQPFYTFVDSNAPGRTKTITHLEFGRAAHRVAHLLRPDRHGVDGKVVGLLLQADTVLYHAIVAGLIVAGYVPFPLSPNNTPEIIIELLSKTLCRRLLTTHAHLKSLINSIKSHIADTSLADELQIEEIPSIAAVYPYLAHETADHPFDPYPPAVHRPSRKDLCLYAHSSGTVGNPKVVPQNHVYWTQLTSPADLKCSNPRFTLGGMSLAPFHTYGLAIQLFMPIYGLVSITVFPPNSVVSTTLPPIAPSPENIIEHMKLTKSDSIETFPTFIQVWALIPEAVEYLKTLRFVGWGGVLPPKAGNRLIEAGVILRQLYGNSECGLNTRFIPPAIKDPEDWEYVQFHDIMKIRWMPQGDGSFECQFLSHEKYETIVNNLPDVSGYATSDLWRPHPTKNGLWKIISRIDDIIVHSSGEKTVPAPMEAIVVGDPLVQVAVIFGDERDQTGILIELKIGAEIDVEDHVQVASLRNKLWPTIKEANSIAPAHSRIFKEMILFTSKGNPLPRASKSFPVKRKAALKIYEKEINAIYENVDAVVRKSSSPTSWSVTDIEAWLLEQASDLSSGCTISPVVDLFEQGFNSLYATSLRLRVVNALRISKDPEYRSIAKDLSQNLVYSYPVIKDLAGFIFSLISSSVVAQDNVA